jgi:hypothetical protein
LIDCAIEDTIINKNDINNNGFIVVLFVLSIVLKTCNLKHIYFASNVEPN